MNFSRFKFYFSGLVFYLIFIHSLLLTAESFIIDSKTTTFTLLAFNFSLTLVLILQFHGAQDTLYNSITTIHKSNEYKSYAAEFFKFAGNFCLVSIMSSICIKYIPLQLQRYIGAFSCFICLIIMLRWNSREFLLNTRFSLYKLMNPSFLKTIEFNEVLIADVWTSFAKPSIQLIGPSYYFIQSLMFW